MSLMIFVTWKFMARAFCLEIRKAIPSPTCKPHKWKMKWILSSILSSLIPLQWMMVVSKHGHWAACPRGIDTFQQSPSEVKAGIDGVCTCSLLWGTAVFAWFRVFLGHLKSDYQPSSGKRTVSSLLWAIEEPPGWCPGFHRTLLRVA